MFSTFFHETRAEFGACICKKLEGKYRDWSAHESEALTSIDKGLRRVKEMVLRNAVEEGVDMTNRPASGM